MLGSQLHAQRSVFRVGGLCRLAGQLDLRLHLLAHLAGLAPRVIEVATELIRSFPFAHDSLVSGLLGRKRRGGLDPRRRELVAGAVNLGRPLGQSLVSIGHRGARFRPNSSDLSDALLSDLRRRRLGSLGKLVSLVAVALSTLCTVFGQPRSTLGLCRSALGLDDCGERIAMSILNLGPGRLDVAGGGDRRNDIVEVSPHFGDPAWELSEALFEGRSRHRHRGR